MLPDAQYEQALAVLRNARNALERSPSMTVNLNEERIRELLLMSLNAQFEGAAAGEVFNAAGKTDILIRAEDRNMFIAECKIITEIENHPNNKRTVATSQDGERYNFVLHANGDPNREIRLAFLPFALQDT